MANVVTELATSSSLRRGKPGEMSSYDQVWLVVSTGAGGDATTSIEVSDLGSFPRPKYSRLGTTGYAATFVCQSVTVDPHKERPYTWTVRATYTSRNSPDSCFAKITRSGTERIMDRWRSGSLVSGDFDWPPDTAEEADGTPLDIAGQPKRTKVGQQLIVVEVMYDAAELLDATGSAWPDFQTIYDTYLFRRNSAAFLGWDAGKVLFVGCDESGIDDNWRTVAYRFLADDLYHVEQRAHGYDGGRPSLEETVTWPDTTVVKVASRVRWYQPYPEANNVDFWDMFSECEADAITNPLPEWPAA